MSLHRVRDGTNPRVYKKREAAVLIIDPALSVCLSPLCERAADAFVRVICVFSLYSGASSEPTRLRSGRVLLVCLTNEILLDF